MERPFIVMTALASTLMFAGVWMATTPASVEAAGDAAPPIATVASPVSNSEPAPMPSLRDRLPKPPAEQAASYNVVRSAYGGIAPIRRAATRSETSVYYSGCREARAAGAAPLYRGQPGYRIEMDGDNDGIACEPYRG